MKRLSLRRGFSWTLVGNTYYAVCQWGVLVIIARFTSPEDVGVFALALAIVTPVFMLTNLQLRAIQATDARGEHPTSRYVWLRVITSIVATLTVLGISFLGGFPDTARQVIWIMVAAKVLESLSDVLYGRFQQLERLDWMSRSLMLRGTITLTMTLVVAEVTGNLVAVVGAVAASSAIALLSHDIQTARRHGVFGNPDSARFRLKLVGIAQVLRAGMPMGFAMMLSSVNTSLPRVVIERLVGERELGFFAATAYFVVAGGTVVNALGQAVAPRLSQYHARGETRSALQLLFRLMLFAVAIGGVGVAVAVVAGPVVLATAYGDEYAAEASLLVWLMLYGAVSYVVSALVYGMTAARRFLPQLPIAGLAFVMTLLLSILLVPRLGATGAAIALTASAATRAPLSWYVNWRALGTAGARAAPAGAIDHGQR